MNYKIYSRVVLTLILALTLQACNAVTPQPQDVQSTEPPLAQTPASQNVDAALCSNPLFPVESGATWTYNSTGSLSGNFHFTDTVTTVRDNGFTLTSVVDGSSITQEWSCKSEGLASLTFGGGAIGGISTNGVQMDLTTRNVQGVILPKTINAGDKWPYSLDLEGKMQYSGTSVDTTGTATFSFNALGEESVTVPAGTFSAMKVHVDVTLDMDVTYFGFSAPAVFTIPSDIWYAPDVGWIKATSSGDIFGMAFNEAIELQSYNIP